MTAAWARLGDATALAARIHAGQLRKGTAIPYVSHLLAVTAIVLEHGGDEDQACAALLHDAVEDGGAQWEPVIAEQFGPRVAAIVRACTDVSSQATVFAPSVATTAVGVHLPPTHLRTRNPSSLADRSVQRRATRPTVTVAVRPEGAVGAVTAACVVAVAVLLQPDGPTPLNARSR